MKYQLRTRKSVDYQKEKISGDYSYKRRSYNHSDSWISKADLRANLESTRDLFALYPTSVAMQNVENENKSKIQKRYSEIRKNNSYASGSN